MLHPFLRTRKPLSAAIQAAKLDSQKQACAKSLQRKSVSIHVQAAWTRRQQQRHNFNHFIIKRLRGVTGGQIRWSSAVPSDLARSHRPSRLFRSLYSLHRKGLTAAGGILILTVAALYASGHADLAPTAPIASISVQPVPTGTAVSALTTNNSASKIQEPDIPFFRIAEVRRHDANSSRPWVIHGDQVYDITDWVPAHPGGDVILRAAGKSIDPYWDIFSFHKVPDVRAILSQYLIGRLHPDDVVDGNLLNEQIEDPFVDDPERHPDLLTRTTKPRNAETPEAVLGAHYLTPNDLFIRNHMWVPKIDGDQLEKYALTVELIDGSSKRYSLHDLQNKFPKRQVTAVLQCSGNRRQHMSSGSGRPTNGLQWTQGAISNAVWEGALLADVLVDAGLDLQAISNGVSEAKHVQFAGLEAYGASIPLKKAVDPHGDVILAYAMNGEPLRPDHGFPLRAIVPGHVAARSVKWLKQITVSGEESDTPWQRRDYKCFGPNETEVDWDTAPAIQELPIQSAITQVKLGGWVKPSASISTNADSQVNVLPTENSEAAREISISGYAFSGGGRAIARVDVSLDSGRTWTQARLLPDCSSQGAVANARHGHAAWAWKRWVYDGSIPLETFTEPEGRPKNESEAHPLTKMTDGNFHQNLSECQWEGSRCTTLLVKAVDEAYNTQPESYARGYLEYSW